MNTQKVEQNPKTENSIQISGNNVTVQELKPGEQHNTYNVQGDLVINRQSGERVLEALQLDFTAFTIRKESPNVQQAQGQDQEESQPEVSIEGENFLELLQMKLEDFYKNRQLPYPSLLGCDPNVAVDEGYVDPVMYCKTSDDRILVHDIFKKLERKRLTLLSIEADPGNGKSALAQKLIDAWSQKGEYINHFHLAFLLDGDTKSKNITEAISDIIKKAVSYNIQEVASEKILRNKDIKILLIFDELDENSDILTTSLSREYSHITKIVTCKRDSQLKPNVPHWSLIIFGIRSQQNEDFLQKFKPHGQVKNMLRFCGNSRISFDVSLCFSSPLHLVVLSTLSKEIGFMTETEVFRKLFNTIAQIRLHKMGKPFADFDLFSLSDLRESVQILGELAMKKRNKYSLSFVKNSATEEMYSLGLLTQEGHTQVANLLQLSAAYSVAVNYYKITTDRTQLFDNVSKYFDLKEHSLFISFLVTLMPEDAIDLFSQMKCISPWLAINDSNLFLMLSNYKGKNLKRMIAATKRSIPPHVQVDCANFQKLPIVTQRKLLKVGLQEKRIKMISITNKEKLQILKNLPMTNVKLIVTIFPHQNSNNLNQLEKVRCKKLVFEFVDGAKDRCLWFHFSRFSSISARIYELRLLGPRVHEELNESIRLDFLEKTIHHLHTKLTTEADTCPIKTLIQKNRVVSIKIDKRFNVDLNDILIAIAESKKIISLDLTYSELVEENSINLMELTQDGNKKYTNLSFKNCRLTCQQDLPTESRIDFIAMKDQIEENTLILRATNPRRLQRPVNMMKNLSGSWIDSLQSLTLFVNEHDPRLWDCLGEFCSKMKTLVLLFQVLELPPEEATAIVKCIKKIEIKYLAVGQTFHEFSHNVCQIEFGHKVELLINCFNFLNVSSVDVLDVHIMFGICNCDRCPRAIDSALNAVHHDRVKIVNVFCHEEAVRRHLLGNDILQGLNVSHQVEEVCESHWQELSTDVKYLNHFKIKKPSRLNLFN